MRIAETAIATTTAMLCTVLLATPCPDFGFPAMVRERPDTEVECPDGGPLIVRCTGGGYGYPGVEIRPDACGGAWDWSRHGELVVTVSNRSDRAERVFVGVGGEGERILLYQSDGIPAHSIREVKVPLNDSPWATDEAVLPADSMKSMLPSARNSAFSRVTILTVYSEQPGTQHPLEFTILGIRFPRPAPEQRIIPAAGFFPFVDRYGQFRHGEWPGKIHSDEELAAAHRAEAEWLAAHPSSPTPDIDEYGGWAAGPQLEATGFFRLEKVDGKWWFVDPAGRLFFSLGVDSIIYPNHGTPLAGREKWFEAVPADADGNPPERIGHAGDNIARRFGTPWPRWHAPFAALVHARCKAWGLNTLGCWCQPYVTSLRRTPYTAVLDTAKTGGGRSIPDVFSDAFADDLAAKAEKLAKSVGDDPWCIGVFVDNELDWRNFRGDVAATAEKYYSTVRDVLKKSLPRHLYLGSRIDNAPREVWIASARHCDVVSCNLYMREPVDELERHAPDKPFLVGEFHFGAKDRGMFGGGLVEVRDQKERADCLRHYIEACLENPRYVGCHWYQLHDQALTGRPGDGENWNIGLVSVCDVPYPEMVEALRDVASRLYATRAARSVGFTSDLEQTPMQRTVP